MARDDGWTAKWSCDKLISHSDVTSAKPIADNIIQVEVKEMPEPIEIATMSKNVVGGEDVDELCSSDDIEFVLNIPKDAVLRRSALERAEAHNVGIGGLGDLYRAINERALREYLPKDTRFILRGLQQHTAVSDVERENNKTYIVQRRNRPSIRVLALDDYDMTAAAVRDGIDNFGACDIILMSNPNCRATDEAFVAAEHTGARLLKWGELLGALNN